MKNSIEIALSFLIGAAFLSILGTLQKLVIGASLELKGHIVPVLFGGITFGYIGMNYFKLKDAYIASQRKAAELHIMNQEKEVLLSEIHHRVKNNMAIISSFMQMQSMQVNEEHVKQMLRECKQRIKAMALIHEKLYQSNNIFKISMEGYIWEMINDIKKMYEMPDVAVTINVKDITFKLDTLIPLGLIINEIISNSFKHGFTNIRNPQVVIDVISDNGFAILSISDNGKGFIDDESNSNRTLGLNIIDSLSKQIEAQVTRTTEDGVRYVLRLPITQT